MAGKHGLQVPGKLRFWLQTHESVYQVSVPEKKHGGYTVNGVFGRRGGIIIHV